MAEGARLESVYTRNRIEGSNPSLTAKLKKKGPDENQDPFSFGVVHTGAILLAGNIIPCTHLSFSCRH